MDHGGSAARPHGDALVGHDGEGVECLANNGVTLEVFTSAAEALAIVQQRDWMFAEGPEVESLDLTDALPAS